MFSLGHLLVYMNYLKISLWTFSMVMAVLVIEQRPHLHPLQMIKQAMLFTDFLCGLTLETNSLLFLGTQGTCF